MKSSRNFPVGPYPETSSPGEVRRIHQANSLTGFPRDEFLGSGRRPYVLALLALLCCGKVSAETIVANNSLGSTTTRFHQFADVAITNNGTGGATFDYRLNGGATLTRSNQAAAARVVVSNYSNTSMRNTGGWSGLTGSSGNRPIVMNTNSVFSVEIDIDQDGTFEFIESYQLSDTSDWVVAYLGGSQSVQYWTDGAIEIYVNEDTGVTGVVTPYGVQPVDPNFDEFDGIDFEGDMMNFPLIGDEDGEVDISFGITGGNPEEYLDNPVVGGQALNLQLEVPDGWDGTIAITGTDDVVKEYDFGADIVNVGQDEFGDVWVWSPDGGPNAPDPPANDLPAGVTPWSWDAFYDGVAVFTLPEGAGGTASGAGTTAGGTSTVTVDFGTNTADNGGESVVTETIVSNGGSTAGTLTDDQMEDALSDAVSGVGLDEPTYEPGGTWQDDVTGGMDTILDGFETLAPIEDTGLPKATQYTAAFPNGFGGTIDVELDFTQTPFPEIRSALAVLFGLVLIVSFMRKATI